MKIKEMICNVAVKYGANARKTMKFMRLCKKHSNGGWWVNFYYKRLMKN